LVYENLQKAANFNVKSFHLVINCSLLSYTFLSVEVDSPIKEMARLGDAAKNTSGVGNGKGVKRQIETFTIKRELHRYVAPLYCKRLVERCTFNVDTSG
jgi:hypothetical protein